MKQSKLLPRDLVLIAAAGILPLISGYVLGSPFTGHVPVAVGFAILTAITLLCYRGLMQTWRISAEERVQSERTLYSQMEALHWISAMLTPRRPLPPMRGMAISPDFAKILYEEIRARRPKTIVELGCGVSTLISSYTLEQLGGGRVISIDHEEQYAEACRARLREHGLDHIARIYSCPLKKQNVEGKECLYYDLSRADLPETIDLLIVDGPPQWVQQLARYPAFPLLRDRLNASTVVLVDDAARSDETAMVDRWEKQFGALNRTFIDTEKGTIILRGYVAPGVNDVTAVRS